MAEIGSSGVYSSMKFGAARCDLNANFHARYGRLNKHSSSGKCKGTDIARGRWNLFHVVRFNRSERQIALSARTRSSMCASVWNGLGVRRSRSVP